MVCRIAFSWVSVLVRDRNKNGDRVQGEGQGQEQEQGLGRVKDGGRNPFQRMFLGHSNKMERCTHRSPFLHVSSSNSSSSRLVFYAPHVPKLS